MSSNTDTFYATVTATSPLTIKPRGSSTSVPAKRLAAYTPAVNDIVAYTLLDVRSVLVLGKVV